MSSQITDTADPGTTRTTTGAVSAPGQVAVAAAVVALLLAAMDSTVMGTILPSVVRNLGGGSGGGYAWVVSGFMLAQVAGTPLAGWISDRVSDRVLAGGSAVIFLAASAIAGSAHAFAVLVAARVLHGLAAGGLVVASYVIVGRAFGAERRAKAQSMLSMVWGVAAVLGPVMGAAVTEAWGWRWVFLINIPICAAVLIATTFALPRRTAERGHQVFPASEYFVIIVGSALLLAGLQGSELGIGAVGGGVAVVAALAVLFLLRRRGGSLIPVHMLRPGSSAGGALATFGACVVMYATVTVLPLHLAALGMSTTGVAVVVGLAAVGWVAGSAVTGGILDKHGYRLPMTGGAVALLGSCALSATGTLPWLAGILAGLGTGAATAATLALIQDQSPPEQLGTATSAATMLRNLGAAAGVNGIAALAATTSGSAHQGNPAFWALAAVGLLLVLVPAAFAPRTRTHL